MHPQCATGQLAAQAGMNIAVHMRDRVVMGVGEGNALVIRLKIHSSAPGRSTLVRTMFLNVVTERVVTGLTHPKDGAVAPHGGIATNARRTIQKCAVLKSAVAITVAW